MARLTSQFKPIHLLIGLVVFALAAFLINEGREPTQHLRVLAGSELEDVLPLLDEIERETGIRLEFDFTGTLDGAESLAAGAKYDLAWFSHAKYLNLLQEKTGQRYIKSSERIMTSPVVLGIKRSLGERLGWCSGAVSWRDIAAQAATGGLRFAMTNPATSNSGFSTVVAAQVAFSGEALSVEQVDVAEMRQLAKGHQLRSGSSGWLVDLYLRQQDQTDGLFNYESVLLSLNQNPQLKEQLCLIYPSEGVITADYPLLLLDEAERVSYQKLVDFLKSTSIQQRLMASGRRPVNAQVALAATFPNQLILEAPFPATLEVVDAILMAYLDRQLRPGFSLYVIDTSGSMEGEGMQQLKTTLHGLSGKDQSLTGQFARYRQGERIGFLPFASQPKSLSSWDFSLNTETLSQLASAIDALQPKGGTAIFDALVRAYELAAVERQKQGADYPISLVLMSDGANTSGRDEEAFRRWYQQHGPKNIPVFSVTFGQADQGQMQRIAELTGGRNFDGRKHSLSHVFKTIRGYQ
ncbi:MAG: substrate-binding domain-containing protein [Gammaproteobacteria bacterium]|nr:substrate-binding domain-containing protein [Gammaproteobacteria bacterium]